jgi:hypothetical protein
MADFAARKKTRMSLTDLSIVQKAFRKRQRHGIGALLHLLCIRLINRLVPFKILRGEYVTTVDAGLIGYPPHYTPSFLAPRALHDFAADPATEMSRAFVDDALRNGDECYAICDGEKLAAYGWYSTRPTPIKPSELVLHFAEGYVYMYKGFTEPHYRGQRLHGIGKTRALQHYLESGYRGMLSYVESTNFESLKSNARMGARVFGSIYVLQLFGRWFTFSSPGCKAFDFRVATTERPAPSSARELQSGVTSAPRSLPRQL